MHRPPPKTHSQTSALIRLGKSFANAAHSGNAVCSDALLHQLDLNAAPHRGVLFHRRSLELMRFRSCPSGLFFVVFNIRSLVLPWALCLSILSMVSRPPNLLLIALGIGPRFCSALNACLMDIPELTACTQSGVMHVLIRDTSRSIVALKIRQGLNKLLATVLGRDKLQTIVNFW